MKSFYLILLICAILMVGGYFMAIYVLPYAIIKPPRTTLDIHPKEFGLNSDSLAIEVEDQLVLRGYHILTEEKMPKGIMIFVHGIGGCKEHYLGIARKMSDIGWESIVIDSRAHGESDGDYCTYGYKEKNDISRIIDWVRMNRGDVKIGIWGNSMGGAIAIQALELDKRLAFGIVESTFCKLDQIVYDYQKRLSMGIGLRKLCDMALKEAGVIGAFVPEEVMPIESVKNITQPVFIGHGDADANITMEYGKRLYHTLQSEQKELVIVKGAEHFNLGEIGGEAYFKKVVSFIESQI